MAQVRQDVILTFNADTQNVDQSLGQVEQSVQNTSKSTSMLTSQLDRMTGGAISGFKNMVSGLKMVKVGLASTGIGLLIVAVGTLVSYFTNTKKGAEQLQTAMATLGAAFDVLKDRVSQIGGALVKFFTGDFKGALEDIKGSFTGITEEIIREASAARDLQNAMNALKDAERGFIRQRAETNKAIAETRLRVEDETLSYDERIAALEEAIALEQETVKAELALAEERARIIREQIALGESLEEDLDKQAEAEARVIEMQTASLRTQKRLEGERQSLLLQRQAQIEQTLAAERKAAEEELKLLLETQKALREGKPEIAQVEQDLQTERGLIMEHNNILAGMEVDQEALMRNKRKEDRDIRLATVAQERAAVVQLFQDSFDAINALQDAFGTQNQKRAERNFKIQKALSLASATISAVEGTQNAFTTAQKSPLGIAFPGYAFVQAGLAAAFGAAKVAAIARSQYESPGRVDSGGTPTGGGGFASAAQPTTQAPTIDLGFLAQGSQSQVIETYVIADNVTTAQQANKKILEQSTL